MFFRSNRLGLALIAAAATLGAASCASAPGTAALNAKTVKKAEFGSPETHALIFGHVNKPKLLNDKPINGLEFVQLNPKMEPMVVSPGRSGTVFFLQPLPAGVTMQLVRYQHVEKDFGGQTVYIESQDISPTAPLSIQVTKPGLLYAGSYWFGSNEKASVRKVFLGANDLGLHPNGKETELDALKSIKSKFAGTAWEAVIESRIMELKK